MDDDRRRHGLAALVLTVACLLAAATVTGAPTTHAAPGRAEALLIGDSVLNGLAQGYGAPGRAALAARHPFVLDSAGCRRLITASCRIPPRAAPTNAITVLRARAGEYDHALVIAAGYDDPPAGRFGVGAAVDVILAEARRQGIEHVIWLTYREAGAAADVSRFRASNDVLRTKLAGNPELRLADWAARSAAMPAGWFSADGIHLGGQAVTAMADLIADALDEIPAGPARCAEAVWSGAAVTALPPAPAGPAGGGVATMAPPARLVDTRHLPGKLGAGRVLTVPVAGIHGVPADAVAALVSVTAVEPCADTFLTAFPCGGAPPTASTINAPASSIVANSAVVRLAGGALCVFSLQPTDVVVDISGWVGPAGRSSTAVTPVRLVDTRRGSPQVLNAAQARLRAGEVLPVAVGAWSGSAAAATATAATVNVTAADPAADGFLTVVPGPCAAIAAAPTTSNVNVIAHRDRAASATVGLGGGELCVFTSTDTDVVVDLQALHGDAGGTVTAADPQRILDTRTSRRLAAGQMVPVELAGGATAAAIVNLTAVEPASSGFLTLYPCDAALPVTSNVNVVAGEIVANRAIVSTAGTSRFCLFSSVETDVVIDVEAVIAPV